MSLKIAALILALTASQATQPAKPASRPDLSGQWQLIAERSEAKGVSAFGDTLTIRQSAQQATFSWVAVVPAGRGSAPGQTRSEPIDSFYRFDGSEVEVASIHSGSSTSVIFHTASWSDDTLVVIQMWRTNVGTRRSMKQVVWIAPDNALVVETTRYNLEQPGDPVRNYYRRLGSSKTAGMHVPSLNFEL